MANQKQKVSFANARGEKLSGVIEQPGESPLAFIIFSHCFTCSKNIGTATRLSRALVDRRYAVMRYDFAGIGESEGTFSETNFSSNIDDIKAAVDHVSSRFDVPLVLAGHSLGGAATIIAASQLPQVRAVVTIAAPDNPAHMHHLLRNKIAEINEKGWAMVNIGGQDFRIEKQFLEDVLNQNLEQSLGSLDRPILILHSEKDELIEIQHGYHLFDMARNSKSFVSLDGADHLLSRTEDVRFAADQIATWASKFVL